MCESIYLTPNDSGFQTSMSIYEAAVNIWLQML